MARPNTPRSGRGGRRFKSCHSDQYLVDSETATPTVSPTDIRRERYYDERWRFLIRHSEVRILSPQPASPVSRIGLRIFWKPPTLPGLSRCTKRLSSTVERKFRSQVPNSPESLRSETCHIRILAWRLGSNYRRPVRNLIYQLETSVWEKKS
jgi:hypothetical protein